MKRYGPFILFVSILAINFASSESRVTKQAPYHVEAIWQVQTANPAWATNFVYETPDVVLVVSIGEMPQHPGKFATLEGVESEVRQVIRGPTGRRQNSVISQYHSTSAV